MKKLCHVGLVVCIALSFILTFAGFPETAWGVVVVDNDSLDVMVQFDPGEPVHLKCKAQPGQKVWVFLEVPSLFPEIQFARPGDSYCLEHGRYVFPLPAGILPAPSSTDDPSQERRPLAIGEFSSEENNSLYYEAVCNSEKIDFGINDFTGLETLTITLMTGESLTRLTTVQRVSLRESKPADENTPRDGTWVGSVEGGGTILFTVSEQGSRITEVSFDGLPFTCTSGCKGIVNGYKATGSISANEGVFNAKILHPDGDVLLWDGSLAHDSALGTLTVDPMIHPDSQCGYCTVSSRSWSAAFEGN